MRVEQRLQSIQDELRSDRMFQDKHDELMNMSTDLRSVSEIGSLVVRAFALCLGGPGLIPRQVKPKISNW